MSATATSDIVVLGEPESPTTTPQEPDRGNSLPWPSGTVLAVELTILGAVTLAVTWVTLELWRIPFGLSLTYRGDEFAGLAHVKGVDETGWWFTNPRLGAPFQLEHYDFPHGGESLQVLMVRMLGLFSDAPAAILNTYLILTFVLVAASAYLVLRYLRFEPMVAGTIAILYSFLPFHFWHLVGHIYRSGYFAAPVASLALLWMAGCDGGLVVSKGPGLRPFEVRRGRLAVVVLAVLLVATTDVVAAAFAPAIAGVVGLLALLRHRAWRTFAIVLLFSASVIILVVAVNAPTLAYQQENGANVETVQRQLQEQEVFALKISRVLLPSEFHPIDFFADQGQKPRFSPIESEGGQALGLIGVAGLISGVVAAIPLGSSVERRRRDTLPADRRDLRATSGLLMILILLLAVPSGIAYLSSVLGFEEIRTWNRIVVYLGFYALLCSAIGLEQLIRWLRRRGARSWAMGSLLVVIGVIGLFDQTPGGRIPYDVRIEAWNRDAQFFSQVEQSLMAESESMVFQLPVIAYPEPDGGNVLSYDHFRGYLHTDDVAWSYGAMRGRPEAAWQRQLAGLPTEVALDSLAAIGFDGLYIDKKGYPDRGLGLRSTIPDTVALEDDRQLFIRLDERRADLGRTMTGGEIESLAQEVLFPVEARLGDGFHASTAAPSGGWFATDDAAFQLRAADSTTRSVTLRLTVLTGPGGGHEVALVGPAGPLAQATSAPVDRSVRFEIDLEVPADGLELRLISNSPEYSDAGDPRQINVEVAELLTVGPTIQALLVGTDTSAAVGLG